MGLADAFKDKMDNFGGNSESDDHMDDSDMVEEDALSEDDQVDVQEHFASESAAPVVEPGFGERIGNIEDADDYESAELYGDEPIEPVDPDYTEDDEPRASM